ncbi:MAG: hypothetical protein ABEJ36_01235 [Candidatus Nanosalina sp.]
MSVLEYSPEDELIDEFEEYSGEWNWEVDEKVDEGEYVRVELYIEEDIENEEFHALGAEIGVTTGVTDNGERYTLSKIK